MLWEQDRNAGPPPYVSVSQLRVLFLADRANGIRMRELTRLLGASPPSVSRLVDRLQAGFVERRPWPDSRREVMLGVTPAGHTHLARVRERRRTRKPAAVTPAPAAPRSGPATPCHPPTTDQQGPGPAPSASARTLKPHPPLRDHPLQPDAVQRRSLQRH
ncbi:MarR family winged helix-turn-helix transcriptional regulator [Streptomyces sp. NPDC059945]|uniref:MarR family winged helix-turn-helix transcriptional regulator n=1 Tax=Streptomyces sp. NPDC059945 TaxID=3347012 RepID=UPI00365A5B35